ncbi:hypothetical protein ACRAKI_12595 [Saccharothrix isguenensis]
MPDDKSLRLQAALETVLKKSKETQPGEIVFSLSVTTLQTAIDNGDEARALEVFEECAKAYASMEEPENWMASRLAQMVRPLQLLIKGKAANDPQADISDSVE